jgi:hypothetical protein
MNSLKKTFSRSTHKLKQSFGGKKKSGSTEYTLLLKTLKAQSKSLSSLDSHISSMIRNVQQQVTIVKSFAGDVNMVYMCGDPALDNREVYVSKSLTSIAERHEQEVVAPFVDNARALQHDIKQYLNEIVAVEKGSLLKQRANKLTDFEIQESKFSTISMKSHATSQAERAFEDARMNYETSKITFDQLDEQAKREMRQLILKRYTQLHDQLLEFFGEIVAEYHQNMAKLSKLYSEIKLIPAPEPFDHEVNSGISSYADSSPEYLDERPPYSRGSFPSSSYSPNNPPPRTTSSPSMLRSGMRSSWNANANTSSGTSTGRSYGALGLPTSLDDVQVEETSKIYNSPPRNKTPPHLNIDWYYVDDVTGEREGPISFHDMKQMKNKGQLTEFSYVFCDGMQDWTQICKHSDLPMYL